VIVLSDFGDRQADEARDWAPACRAVGLPELADAYPDAASRRAEWPALRERFRAAAASLTRAELEQRLRAEDCIFAVYAAPPEVVTDADVVANGYLMAHPAQDKLRLASAPAQFDDAQPAIPRPAPRLGEHGAEILAELGYDAGEISTITTDGTVVVP
jgi:crotonobetainyl-CoA:carnitine CoA-transferase CaiB-like acyl-CoA transferase